MQQKMVLKNATGVDASNLAVKSVLASFLEMLIK